MESIEVLRSYLLEAKEGGPGYVTREHAATALQSMDDIRQLASLYDSYRSAFTSFLADLLIRIGEISFFDTDLCLAIAFYIETYVDEDHEDIEKWFFKARTLSPLGHPIRDYEGYRTFYQEMVNSQKYVVSWLVGWGRGRKQLER